MKIGLFGGTFDPIHIGHLIVAERVRDALGLGKIVFIPSLNPPHKKSHVLAPADARLKMVQWAVEGNPFFEVSEIELGRAAPSYTIETVLEYRRHYSKDALFFIMGGDSLYEVHTWHKAEELVALCEFAVVARPGFAINELDASALHLTRKAFEILTRNIVRMELIGVSSTEVRQRLKEKKSIRYLVPEKVREFLEKGGIYQA